MLVPISPTILASSSFFLYHRFTLHLLFFCFLIYLIFIHFYSLTYLRHFFKAFIIHIKNYNYFAAKTKMLIFVLLPNFFSQIYKIQRKAFNIGIKIKTLKCMHWKLAKIKMISPGLKLKNWLLISDSGNKIRGDKINLF